MYIYLNINIYLYSYIHISYITRISGNCLVFEFPSFFPPEFLQIRAVKLHEVQALKQYQSKRPRSAKALAPKFLDPLRLVYTFNTPNWRIFFLVFFLGGSTDQPIPLQQLINWIKFLKDEGPELEYSRWYMIKVDGRRKSWPSLRKSWSL